MSFDTIVYVEKLEETLRLLKSFRDQLNNTTLGGMSCENLSQDLWDILDLSIKNMEEIVTKNN